MHEPVVDAAAAEEAPPVSPNLPVLRGRKPGYRFIQWNIKWLTNTDPQRIDLLAKTLHDIGGPTTGFAVCVIEEVKVSGGKSAVEDIVKLLNEKRNRRPNSPGGEDVEDYVCRFTDVVNPSKPPQNQEVTAIIWNVNRLGNLLDTGAGYCMLVQEENIDGTIRIGNTSVLCDLSKEIWDSKQKQYETPNIFPSMDVKPAVFSFKPDGFVIPFHVIGVHLSQSREQNLLESVFMQEMLYKMAENYEYVIFLGDMNIDHCSNHRIWYQEEDFDNEYELQYLKPIKDKFFTHYKRVINKDLPTNLFPFMMSEKSHGCHNDDIWIPKNMFSPFTIEAENYGGNRERHGENAGLYEQGSTRPGQIHTIPTYVLTAWEKQTRLFFDKEARMIDADEENERTKPFEKRFQRGHKLISNLQMLWSDHRPVSANLKFMPPEQDLIERMNAFKIKDDLAYKLIKETPYDVSPDTPYGYQNMIASELKTYYVSNTMIQENGVIETDPKKLWEFFAQKCPSEKTIKIGEQLFREDMLSEKLLSFLVLNEEKSKYQIV